MNTTPPLRAVIWDYDGTLVDTSRKNLSVTRRIVERTTGRSPDGIAILRVQESYHAAIRQAANWRTLYREEFGFTAEQTESAGLLWEEIHREDRTGTDFYDGIHEVLEELSHLPQAVVSMNVVSMIADTLKSAGVGHRFEVIIGQESLPAHHQKPHPRALLLGLEKLNLLESDDPGTVLYVGDHEVDASCAQRTNEWLGERGFGLRVRCISAVYGDAKDVEEWSTQPDHHAHEPGEISRLARRLG